MRTLVIDNQYGNHYGYQLPLDTIKNNLLSLSEFNPYGHWLTTHGEDQFIPLFRSTGGPPLGANFVGVAGLNYWQTGVLDVETILNTIYASSGRKSPLDHLFWETFWDSDSWSDPTTEDQHTKAFHIVTSHLFPEQIVVVKQDGEIDSCVLRGQPMERLREFVAYINTTLPERSMSIYLDL